MHLYKIITLCLLLQSPFLLQAQEKIYNTTFKRLTKMLTGEENLPFKEAVYLTENAYLDNSLSRSEFEINIVKLSRIAKKKQEINSLFYTQKDRDNVQKNAVLFSLMMDTTSFIVKDDTLYHFPFSYDFSDPFGDDWHNMLVSKLLVTKKGNCHSLPYLYKILADEIGAEAYLALAPNHIYIKSPCEKTGWYNTELTSGTFPVDAWIMASSYIYLDAIRNGIYMKALTDEESIAMCVLDLAMGYDRKFPGNDGSFILKCCALALEHFPNYITAILLKAETIQRVLMQMVRKYNKTNPKNIFDLVPNAASLWEEMEQAYFQAHKLGYRQMSKEMYLEWVESLR